MLSQKLLVAGSDDFERGDLVITFKIIARIHIFIPFCSLTPPQRVFEKSNLLPHSGRGVAFGNYFWVVSEDL